MLGYARVYLDRPFRWLPYATEAVFPRYILHQSLIVVLVFWLAPKHRAVAEPALVLVGTVLGCALLHELLIRRVGPAASAVWSQARGPTFARSGTGYPAPA